MAFLHRQGQYVNAPRPHLILLDLAMPKKDGFEVLAEINEDPGLKSIPVMILTSRQSDRDLVQSLGVPPSRYSGKPLELTRFNIILNQARGRFHPAPDNRQQCRQLRNRLLSKSNQRSLENGGGLSAKRGVFQGVAP